MKKLLSINYSDGAFNVAMLLLRLALGALMIPHGYSKLIHFAEQKNKFMNFLGMGSTLSFSLLIFAELICSALLVLGLFTRGAVIPLIIAMSVALFKAHHGEVFGDGEHAALFLAGYFVVLLCGPGKVSVDGMMK